MNRSRLGGLTSYDAPANWGFVPMGQWRALLSKMETVVLRK